MSLTLNTSRLLTSALASSGVIAGLTGKMSLEQLNLRKSPLNMVAQALFAVGWLAFAYSMSGGISRQLYPGPYGLDLAIVAPVLIIIATALMMNNHQTEGKEIAAYLPIACAMSWLFIGYYIATRRNLSGYMQMLVMAAPVAAVVSMMWLMPEQRKLDLIDGPAAHLFTASLAVLTLANAL